MKVQISCSAKCNAIVKMLKSHQKIGRKWWSSDFIFMHDYSIFSLKLFELIWHYNDVSPPPLKVISEFIYSSLAYNSNSYFRWSFHPMGWKYILFFPFCNGDKLLVWIMFLTSFPLPLILFSPCHTNLFYL